MTALQDERMGVTPLLVPHSHLTTESNKTGSWRFLKPCYDEKTAPCSAACPAGEDIGRIEMLAAQGLFKEAWETILRENPFPAVCGRVCHHPCEAVCNRREFDEAVAIHTIERFLADTAARYDFTPAVDRLPSRREKIAVAGAGPAGLAAAWFLSRLGYTCDVFEAAPEPGGVLRWGIPSYRLPVEVVRSEIDRIRKAGAETHGAETHGIDIHCGKRISERFLEEAKGSYDAVFMGCGHSRSLRLMIEGEDLEGVSDGLEFLQSIRRGEAPPPSLRGTVAVIGGGNTAIDVARSVVRLGARVILVYRRRREDMPAFSEEVEMALGEGVELRELLSPVRIEPTADGCVLTLQPMQAVGEDASGRTRVEPAGQGLETLHVTHVFKAVGLEAFEGWYNPPPEREGILRLQYGVLSCPGNAPAVVYGGDLTTPVKSVVHAVASGKEAAIALDTLLREGREAVGAALKACSVGPGPSLSMEIHMHGPRCERNPHVVSFGEINVDHFQFTPRITRPRLLLEERVRSFAEIDLRISAGLAMRESERCFNCGLCNQCDNCRLFCPDLAVIREDTPRGRRVNYDYCKGCGICVVECPRNAMSLGKE